MEEDNSLEFDMLEDARRRLMESLMRSGRERLEAERIAFYVMQGIREAPKLLKALSQIRPRTDEEILAALNALLDNASSLDKARSLLLGLDDSASQ